jgi:diaminopimelate epimerase
MTSGPTRPTGSAGLSVIKGHGTENDFLLIPDLAGTLSLSATLVRALCDRRAGLGADGVLRVLRTKLATEPDVRSQADQAEFFMDYRNADGSIVEMCGNGVRVVARYLQQAGLAGERIALATRGGTRAISFEGADVTVSMGPATMRPERPTVDGGHVGIALALPNPHVVVELAGEQELAALDLSRPPRVEPPLPDGQNVEFFVRRGPRQLAMRVHERGVGETRSCGTGICAVAVAAAGAEAGTGRWQVEVPGGRCTVGWAEDGSVTLSGPAVLVGEITVDQAWLAAHR